VLVFIIITVAIVFLTHNCLGHDLGQPVLRHLNELDLLLHLLDLLVNCLVEGDLSRCIVLGLWCAFKVWSPSGGLGWCLLLFGLSSLLWWLFLLWSNFLFLLHNTLLLYWLARLFCDLLGLRRHHKFNTMVHIVHLLNSDINFTLVEFLLILSVRYRVFSVAYVEAFI